MSKIITMKQQVYRIIKLRIANGTYARGQRLQELELAADLDVSRSPVREALKQLVAEGLLLEIPNKGVVVREFADRELRDVFEFRRLTECYAVDWLEAHPSPWLDAELKRLQEHEIELSSELDYVMDPGVNVHYSLVESTGNKFLIETHRQASTITMIHHDILFADKSEGYQESLDAHAAITRALLERDFSTAKQVLTRHLAFSCETICKGLSTKQAGT